MSVYYDQKYNELFLVLLLSNFEFIVCYEKCRPIYTTSNPEDNGYVYIGEL